MILAVALPPVRLAGVQEQLIPGPAELLLVAYEVQRIDPLLLRPPQPPDVQPGLVADPRAIQRRVDLQQPVLPPQLFGPFVDHVPRTRPRRIDLAGLRCRAAAQAIA